MGWKCKLIDEKEFWHPTRGQRFGFGTMWLMIEWWESMKAEGIQTYEQWVKAHPDNRPLSRYYFQHNYERRAPLSMWIPGRTTFLIDGCVTNKAKGHGWKVTGIPPIINVQPSINCVGIYHGWLTNGILSADCEGRTYGAEG